MKYLPLLTLLFSVSACTYKQPVLPAGALLCDTPFYGDDCMDNMNIMPKFYNGLPCNRCQVRGDGDKDGCAWVNHDGLKGNPDLWCTRNCDICSALNADFVKK